MVLAWAASMAALAAEGQGAVSVQLEGLSAKGGIVQLALYPHAADFMVEKKAVLYSFKINQEDRMKADLGDLPAGDYAFAVFQDENENQQLDKNLFGVPVEPYGFSKKPASKWRLPSFDEVKFRVEKQGATIQVKLERWKL